MTPLQLRVTAYRLAERIDRQSGLLAYLVLEIDSALRIEDVTLRRTLAGRLTLAFPRRTDRQGTTIDLVHPIGAAARDRIEREVFEQLGITTLFIERSTRSAS